MFSGMNADRLGMNGQNKKRAFGMMEIVVIVVVISLIMRGAFDMISFEYRLHSVRGTKQKMDEIHEHIISYFMTHGKLPLPAKITDGPTGANYVNSWSGASHAVGDLVVGAVPVADIGLSVNHLFDDWHHKFKYVVNGCLLNMASGVSSDIQLCRDNHAGVVSLLDKTASAAGVAINEVAYILISYGHDGIGAYDEMGTVVKSCVASTAEGPNCSSNHYVIAPRNTSSSAGNDYYDDYLVFVKMNDLQTIGLVK